MPDTILLPPRLDAHAVEDLANRLPDACDACDAATVTMDASQVTHMSALAVQLILAAARHLRAGGGQLHIATISDRATEQLRVMGLTPTSLSEGLE